MKMGIGVPILLAVLLCGFLPAVSYGEQITIGLTGKVKYVGDSNNLFGGQINIGDTLTGTYIYDLSTPDSEPEGYAGVYWHYNAPCGVSVTINGFNFQTDPNNVQFLLGIVNSGPDTYCFTSYNNSPLSNGALVDRITWQLDDTTGQALSSDALPTTAPNLADWGKNRDLDIYGPTEDCKVLFAIRADITSVYVIPEPATLLFLVFGAAICRRR